MSDQEMKIRFSPLADAHFVVGDASPLRESQKRPSHLPRLCLLNQIHGIQGYQVDFQNYQERREGDWHYTHESGVGLGIFVADCTAILIAGTNRQGSFVAAIHAGWRGTAAGIIQQCLEKTKPSGKFWAWLSPSICSHHFEIDQAVIDQFPHTISDFLRKNRPGHFLFDLKSYQIQILKEYGASVWNSPLCTYEQEPFFSYRKSKGNLKGRHLAWICLN